MIAVLFILVISLGASLIPVHAAIVSCKVAQTNSETHPCGVGLLYFAKRVKELTNGEVEVKVFSNNALGGERELVEAAQLGQLEIGTSSGSVVATFAKELDFLGLPFLFSGYDHVEKVFNDPSMRKILDNSLRKAGLVPLGYCTGGIRQVYAKKPIKSIKDFKGLKIRTMEVPGINAAFKAIGAIPVPMDFAELYSGLQSGVVDGAEGTFLTWMSSKLYEVSKYGLVINYQDSGRIFYANPKFMDSLSPANRKAIEQAMTECVKIVAKGYKDGDQTAVENARKLGCEVETTDLKPFIKAMQPVYKDMPPTLGAGIITKIQAMK
jgi:C4-dicarboxylate-binding protein DctP